MALIRRTGGARNTQIPTSPSVLNPQTQIPQATFAATTQQQVVGGGYYTRDGYVTPGGLFLPLTNTPNGYNTPSARQTDQTGIIFTGIGSLQGKAPAIYSQPDLWGEGLGFVRTKDGMYQSYKDFMNPGTQWGGQNPVTKYTEEQFLKLTSTSEGVRFFLGLGGSGAKITGADGQVKYVGANPQGGNYFSNITREEAKQVIATGQTEQFWAAAATNQVSARAARISQNANQLERYAKGIDKMVAEKKAAYNARYPDEKNIQFANSPAVRYGIVSQPTPKPAKVPSMTSSTSKISLPKISTTSKKYSI